MNTWSDSSPFCPTADEAFGRTFLRLKWFCAAAARWPSCCGKAFPFKCQESQRHSAGNMEMSLADWLEQKIHLVEEKHQSQDMMVIVGSSSMLLLR